MPGRTFTKELREPRLVFDLFVEEREGVVVCPVILAGGEVSYMGILPGLQTVQLRPAQ